MYRLSRSGRDEISSLILLGPGRDYKSQLYRQVVITVGARHRLQIPVIQTGRHCCWGQAGITNSSCTDRSSLLLGPGRYYKSQLYRQVTITVVARQRLQIPVTQTGRQYCWGQAEITNPSYTDRSSLLLGPGREYKSQLYRQVVIVVWFGKPRTHVLSLIKLEAFRNLHVTVRYSI